MHRVDVRNGHLYGGTFDRGGVAIDQRHFAIDQENQPAPLVLNLDEQATLIGPDLRRVDENLRTSMPAL